MQLTITKNWTGGTGSILHTSHNVKIKQGDNYIGYGMSGENIFTLRSDAVIYERRVVAVSPYLDWKLSGNNTLNRLPVIDLDSFL